MSQFVCPYCGGCLTIENGSYHCESNHCFDIASQGYVNLLPPNKKHSKDPGDNREMVAARNRFLSAGYYEPLRRELMRLAVSLSGGEAVSFLDSGCGEGYYTEGIVDALREAGKTVNAAGIDISKSAVKLAARRVRGGEFAVASAYALPCADESTDLLLNCFSPLAAEEFRRVLRVGGHFLYVVPGPRHLWELKSVAYLSPYENVRHEEQYDGVMLTDKTTVTGQIHLPDAQSVQDLFSMTPYLWNTPEDGRQRLAALTELDTQLEFDVYVYKKS